MAEALLADLPAPERSFASDNTAGAHPDVLEAIVAANRGHVAPYGDDDLTVSVESRFAELFGRPVEVALAFGGTGANVVALHTIVSRDSLIVCSSDAHIAIDEAGAPEHITGAQLVGYPWNVDGKITADDVADTAARLGRVHIHDVTVTRHVVSVTQATEVGTVYRPEELRAICDEAHRHGMVVHLDGARLANALVAWGHTAADLSAGCRELADCGIDVLVFGGTKAGLLGAEAVVFCRPDLADGVGARRKQATQTASKMRYLAAQYACALEDGRILDWAGDANRAAADLTAALVAIDGVRLAYPAETNAVFCHLPAAAIGPLEAWTPFYVWDAATSLVRFVCSWDTSSDDVQRLAAGVRAAVAGGTDPSGMMTAAVHGENEG